MCLLFVCMVMWSKGSKFTSGEVCFCHFYCWVTVYSVAFFQPFLQLKLFLRKKPKQKYAVLHALMLQIQPVTFSSFPFSLTGQFRKGSPVRVFRWWWGSLSTDCFSSCETFTLRTQTVAFSFVNILWEATRLQSTALWILSLQLLYAIHSELFYSSFKQVFYFFNLGTIKKQKSRCNIGQCSCS